MKTLKKFLFLSILTASLASVFTLSTPALADGGWGGHGWGHGGGWGYGGGGWGHPSDRSAEARAKDIEEAY
ncbi:MAG: hypothetical protein EB015_21475, partial [Methylocystaceae bacterium]|nr:hypothetical protein [Methylocystaceae bacterium]